MIVVWDVHATITPFPLQAPAQRQAENTLEQRVHAEPQRATPNNSGQTRPPPLGFYVAMADGNEGHVRS